MKDAEPGGESGIYRLSIANGKWDLVASFNGMPINPDGAEGFPSLTLNGELAMMSDTSAVQIYWAKWIQDSDSH